MSIRALFPLISLILTAGAALLILLTLLAGAVNGGAEDGIYFLQAETGNIPGAPPISRWTLWNICGDSNGNNANCGNIDAAFPFDPQSNFPSQKNVPESFIGTNSFYYMSRVVFSFMLIALFLSVCSLFLGVFALCFRIASIISSLVAMGAWLAQTVAAAVMTACFVAGQQNFQNNGQAASIGKEAFGFNWAAMACLMISTIFYCVGGTATRRRETRTRGVFGREKRTSYVNDAETSSFVRA